MPARASAGCGTHRGPRFALASRRIALRHLGPSHRRLGVLLSGLAALAGAAGEIGGCGQDPDPRSSLAVVRSAWSTAFGALRPLDGRIVGVPHALFHAGRRPAAARETFAALVRRAAARAGTRSAPDRYVRGLVELGLDHLDAAAEQLTAATVRLPEDAEPWSDLAALYLERAERAHRPHDNLLALDAAERALAISPRLPPAEFNRALALERLFLPSRSAWGRAMAGDDSPGWTAEAKRHRAAAGWTGEVDAWPIQRPRLEEVALSSDAAALAAKVYQVPQAARELGEEVLLAAWGDAVTGGRRQEAARALAVARALGSALAATHGEWMLADAVETIDRAVEEAGHPDHLARLATAHAAYGRGLALYQRQDFARAAAVFHRAAELLRAAGSPFDGWARFQLARCSFQHSHYARVALLLAPLVSAGTPQRRRGALQGRSWRLDGLVAGIQGRPIAALESFGKARAIFERLGESGSLVALDAASSEVLATLGRRNESWIYLGRALNEASRTDPISDSGQALERAALAAEEEEVFSAALAIRQEQLRRARLSRSPLRIAEVLLHRAETHGLAGRRGDALSDIAEARRALAAVPDVDARRGALGDILFAEGRIRRIDDPASAIAPLASAARIFAQTHYRYNLARAHLELGLAAFAVHQDDRAERELQSAAREVESTRGSIADSASRSLYLGQMREVFEVLVEFEARRQRADRALAASEQFRGRALLDLLLVPEGPAAHLSAYRPLPPRRIAATLPADFALVEFAFARGRLFTWIAQRGALRLRESELGPAAGRRIGVLVRRLHEEVLAGDDQPSAAALYHELFWPIEPDLPAGATLLIAPDGPLESVPFAALRDGHGRFLVERHPLLLAGSASLFIAGRAGHRAAAGAGRGAPLQVLAVGDPAFDRAAFPQLPRLPAAGAEAAAIARMLPGSLVLLGREASADRMLARAGSFTALHFAGHALVNSEQPLLSHLLLAPGPAPGASGVLYARDLLGRRFARTRLVLLSACRTADRQSTSGQGLAGLSSVFLAAGVPAVIATLWNVEDRAASRLLAGLYRHLATGMDTAAALRSAQLDLLASRNPALRRPAAWAGFELLGDSPRFQPASASPGGEGWPAPQ
jgi:CHAT domain-containing protein